MLGPEAIVPLIATKGLWIVAPIAVVEGPIVTVIAAWLASRGLFNPFWLFVVVVLADLVGDFLFYALGRWGMRRLPESWRRRLKLDPERMQAIATYYQEKGGRTLILGKITHSGGFIVLCAAGLARMPIWAFLWYNLVATVPKSIVFIALGYTIGAAYARIDTWIGRGALAMLVLLAVAIGGWLLWRRRQRAKESHS